MRNAIQQKDYEKYELILPYKAMFGRARQRFIYSELEKMHPCFSDEFCLDSSFKGLSKKGIRSDVLVMHKFKLAEYEARRAFPGLGLALSEGKGKAGRYFVSRKIKTAVLAFFMLLILTASFFLRAKLQEVVKHKDTIEEPVAFENQSLLSSKPLPPSFAGGDFFELVIKNGGSVNSLSWKSDFFTETIEAEVEGVYPELLSQSFPAANLSSVKYKDEKPKLKFKNLQKLDFHSAEKVVSPGGNNYGLQSSVRKALEENKAELKEESLRPYRILFTAPRQNFINLVSVLYDLFSDNAFLITEITYSIEANQSLEVSISAEEKFAYAAGLPLKNLSEKLLPGEAGLETSKKSMPEKNHVRNYRAGPASNENYGLKVGEITRDEILDAGRIQTIRTVFYKTPDGKMLKKEEVVN